MDGSGWQNLLQNMINYLLSLNTGEFLVTTSSLTMCTTVHVGHRHLPNQRTGTGIQRSRSRFERVGTYIWKDIGVAAWQLRINFHIFSALIWYFGGMAHTLLQTRPT